MPPKPSINAKKAKLYNSRTIRTELSDPSFTDKEKLSIPDFLKTREFEIRSFEQSQLNTKYASSSRVFQSLPRTLRRRTASHNVKRIPKRLRSRAIREMQNSVNGQPEKRKHQRGRQLYRLQVMKKLLKLGSRLKLMRGVPNEQVLKDQTIRNRIKELNTQIKSLEKDRSSPEINNDLGSYDNTGVDEFAPRPKGNLKYHKRQKNFVWLPTHVWHAKRFHMTKQYGYQIPLAPTQKCFKAMNRHNKHDAVIFDTSFHDKLIIEIADNADFIQFLLEITKYKKKLPTEIVDGTKSYSDWIFLENEKVAKVLIYANISLKKILVSVLPSLFMDIYFKIKAKLANYKSNTTINDCRYSLGSIDICGPQALPAISKILHLYKLENSDIQRTWRTLAHNTDSGLVPIGTTLSFSVKDPRFWKRPSRLPPSASDISLNELVIALNNETSSNIDSDSIANLLSSRSRNESYDGQMSIKSISKEFNKLSPLDKSVSYELINRSRIPLLITKLAEGSWSLILPWYWVLPIWISATKVRQIKVGGLKQRHQFNFENEIPTFPYDFPFLRDGWLHNNAVGTLTEAKFAKLKQSHVDISRPDFQNSSIISPFKCDWTAIRNIIFLKKLSGKTDLELAQLDPGFATHVGNFSTRELKSLHDIEQSSKSISKIYTEEKAPEISIVIYCKNNEFHKQFVDGAYEIKSLVDVKMKQLPVIQIAIRLQNKGSISDGARIFLSDSFNTNPEGFVTSGAYNLNEGQPTAIGLIRADVKKLSNPTIYIRNIGKTTFYPAKFVEIK
ncbi:hypothetical protein G9P44_003629 [Scheffersomyces stipitis]|nr:hypothetical protein G9P44_003629 [Scheffersomyces stipitis]